MGFPALSTHMQFSPSQLQQQLLRLRPRTRSSLSVIIQVSHSVRCWALLLNHALPYERLISALDKVDLSERDAAHTTFQNIAFAYAILSDERRRKRYDTTGSTSESLIDDDDFDWTSFFRNQYADIVTSSKIDNFKSEYQDSPEEHRDLLKAFQDCKGKMNGVFESVMMSNPLDDEERFRQIIDKAIADGEVKAFSAYVDETEKSKKGRMNRAKKEAEEAAELRKEKGVYNKLYGDGKGKSAKNAKQDKKGASAEADLVAMIQQRQKTRANNFLDNLEAKYSKGKKLSAQTEPSEEAFKKMAKRLNNKKEEQGDADAMKNTKRAKKPNQKSVRKTATKPSVTEPPTDPESADDEDEDDDIDLTVPSADEDDEEEEEPPKKKAKTKAASKAKPKQRVIPIRKGRARLLRKSKT